MTRIALDTNVLVYLTGVARDPSDAGKIDKVRALIQQLTDVASLIAPVQALGELFVVLRRSGFSSAEAREELLGLTGAFGAPPSEARTATAAADLVVDHHLQFWDAMIVTAAIDAGCAILLSEDMHHGFVARGLTVVNPFAESQHEKLAALLAKI